jgi:hypothetical protein
MPPKIKVFSGEFRRGLFLQKIPPPEFSNHVNHDADDNQAIRDVKGGPTIEGTDVDVDKVYNVAVEDAVQKVTENASDEAAEDDLCGGIDKRELLSR